MKVLTVIPAITTTLPATHADAVALAAQSERCAAIAAHEENAKTMQGALKTRLIMWIGFLVLFLAGTCISVDLWVSKRRTSGELSDVVKKHNNLVGLLDSTRKEAALANAALLDKTAELSTVKGESAKAFEAKAKAEADAKTVNDKLAGVEKEKAEALAKAKEEKEKAEKAEKELAEAKKAPQTNPSPIVFTTPGTAPSAPSAPAASTIKPFDVTDISLTGTFTTTTPMSEIVEKTLLGFIHQAEQTKNVHVVRAFRDGKAKKPLHPADITFLKGQLAMAKGVEAQKAIQWILDNQPTASEGKSSAPSKKRDATPGT